MEAEHNSSLADGADGEAAPLTVEDTDEPHELGVSEVNAVGIDVNDASKEVPSAVNELNSDQLETDAVLKDEEDVSNSILEEEKVCLTPSDPVLQEQKDNEKKGDEAKEETIVTPDSAGDASAEIKSTAGDEKDGGGGDATLGSCEESAAKDDPAASSNTLINSEEWKQDASLEPVSADESDPGLSAEPAPAVNEHYTEIQSPEAGSSPAGPYDDGEDISDAELDLTSENVELPPEAAKVPTGESASPQQQVREVDVDGKGSSLAETASSGDADREIIDLKLEDAVKSDAGSTVDDANRQSKGPSEDLEVVSDEELPEASHSKEPQHAATASVPRPKAVVEGGEDVSSEDEEAVPSTAGVVRAAGENLNKDPTRFTTSSDNIRETAVAYSEREPVSPTALPVSPTALAEPISPTALPEPVSPTALPEPVSPANLPEPVSPTNLPEPVSPTNLPEPVSPAALPELAPLDAEPISDEEDNSGLGEEDDEDGEAGEIKSPTEDITSPPSSPEQSKANLGEVEPVSADDSNDTDGELPSGDEDETTTPAGEQSKAGAKFESIDSDDDGDLRGAEAGGRLRPNLSQNIETNKKSDNGYMESISDEENLDGGSHKDAGRLAKSDVSIEGQGLLPSQTGRDAEGDKKLAAPNFNEHQVELDYEEADADDGEARPEEGREEPKLRDGGEDGELQEQGGASDKDEGELSDDDCEEGEIKEPGTRKPFVKPVCRFFQRGNCTWGINCRFLHPGVNDKGNYQMIEIPGFQPTGVHARLGPGPWAEQQAPVEQIEIPPPPLPDTPPPETAWERGLRIAKEQRKKATERKEQEPDFEEKRLNLSVDEERELNKENERVPRIIPKDPYYDQQAYEEDEYYKISRDPWQTGHYENFEVRYNREPSFSPPYREKPPPMPAPPMRYSRQQYSPPPPPVDKFGRDRERVERREEYRPKPAPPPPVANDYPSPSRRPDEWVDPWRRQTTRKSSKSPQRTKHKRSRSRGGRGRRSVSDSSNSSRSASGSSSGSSRSSRSYSGSSGSSSRSRSPEPAPPGVDRHDRYPHQSPSRDQPRSAVSVRGRGGEGGGDGGRGGGGGDGGRGGGGGDNYHNSYDSGFRRDQQGYGRPRGGGGGRGDGGGYQHRGGYRGRGGPGGPYNNYRGGRGGGRGGGGGGPDGYPNRDMMRGGRGRDDRMERPRAQHSPPGRPLPYVRPRPRSASSRSSSSRSRSRSRSRRSGEGGRGRYSSSRSSSGSSSSRSSSSSSAGSADSEHLYRDLGSPGKNAGPPAAAAKKKRGAPNTGHKDKAAPAPPLPASVAPPLPGSQRTSSSAGAQQQRHHMSLEHIPIPRDTRESREPSGRREGRESRDSRDPRESRGSRDPSMPAPGGPPGGRSESRYASRNAPQAPVKAMDPLKVVGQKSNIKLTLLPKQQQSSLPSRPNPLDSPPHKRRISDRDSPPPSAPAAKRMSLPVPQTSALRIASEKAAKIMRQEKGPRGVSPPPQTSSSSSSSAMHHHASMSSSGGGGAGLPPTSSSSSSRARAPVSPQKQPSSGLKSRAPEPQLAKTAPKMAVVGGGAAASLSGAAAGPVAPSSGAGSSGGAAAKAKKSMSSRREELLKQLKAVEDAIARKKTKLT